MARNYKHHLFFMPELATDEERVNIPGAQAQNSLGLPSMKPHQFEGASALLRSSSRISFKPGASVGAGDMPSTGMIPSWVSFAPSLMYVALAAGTSSNKNNSEKVMMKSIEFLAATYSVVYESKKFLV